MQKTYSIEIKFKDGSLGFIGNKGCYTGAYSNKIQPIITVESDVYNLWRKAQETFSRQSDVSSIALYVGVRNQELLSINVH